MTGDEKERKRKPISEENACSRMARICSAREYAAADIEEKLRRMGLEHDTVARIVGKLKAAKYVDDERFARSFISDKIRFNKWGKIKIRFALRQKHISQETIDNAFSEFPESRMNESLAQLVENRMKTVKGASPYEKRAKVIRFALNRGFPMDEIMSCLRNIEAEDQTPPGARICNPDS